MTGDQEQMDKSGEPGRRTAPPWMSGFIELVERAQREAQELHDEARRTLQQAREEATRIRSEARTDAEMQREQAGIEVAFLRRDSEQLWSAFSRLLAAASEVVNIIGPLVPPRADGDPAPGGEAASVTADSPAVEGSEGAGGHEAPEGIDPSSQGGDPEAATPTHAGVPNITEEQLSEAERELRGLLENH